MLAMTIQGVLAVGLFAYESVDYTSRLLPTFLFQFKVSGGLRLETGAPRVASGLQDFHETSLLANMTAALAFGMLAVFPERRKKFLTLLTLFVSFLFITMRTESRAGIGSMLVMLVMLALLLPRLRFRRIRTTTGFMLCAGTIYTLSHICLYMVSDVYQKPRMVYVIEEILGGGKLIDTGHKQKESGRIYMYKKSFRTLFNHNPLLGLGVGNLKYLVHLPHAHSLYFSLVLDFGLAGLIFLAVLAKMLFQRIYLVIKLPDSQARSMALAAVAGLSGAAVHCLVDFEYNYTSLWLFLGLVTASCNVALSDARRQNATTSAVLP
jgi:O-antigen ligase